MHGHMNVKFVGLFVQVSKPDDMGDITSSLYGLVSLTFGKINVELMALGVENEIKKPSTWVDL
jgi:hypothetical protein